MNSEDDKPSTVALLCAGHWPEVRVFLALGRSLVLRGYHVSLLAPQRYRELAVNIYQISRFVETPSNYDPMDFIWGVQGKKMLQNIDNYDAQSQDNQTETTSEKIDEKKNIEDELKLDDSLTPNDISNYIYKVKEEVHEILWKKASKETITAIKHTVGVTDGQVNCKAIVVSTFLAAYAYSLAEVKNIPLFIVRFLPETPTEDFPHPLFSWIFPDISLLNKLTYYISIRYFYSFQTPIINAVRHTSFNLEPLVDNFYAVLEKYVPKIYIWDEAICPKPKDWPSNAHVSGYFHSSAHLISEEENTSQKKFANLKEKFLSKGKDTVLFLLDMVPFALHQKILNSILTASISLNIQAVVLIPSGLIDENAHRIPIGPYIPPGSSSTQVWVEREDLTTPSSSLIPSLLSHCQAVVHDGYPILTGLSIDFGVPSVVIHMFEDQEWCASRLSKIGIGPQNLLSLKDLLFSPKKLEQSLSEVLSSEKLNAGAKLATTNHHTEDSKENIHQIKDAGLIIRNYLSDPCFNPVFPKPILSQQTWDNISFALALAGVVGGVIGASWMFSRSLRRN